MESPATLGGDCWPPLTDERLRFRGFVYMYNGIVAKSMECAVRLQAQAWLCLVINCCTQALCRKKIRIGSKLYGMIHAKCLLAQCLYILGLQKELLFPGRTQGASCMTSRGLVGQSQML